MGQPFGFMAFLGIIGLIGVIVSHIIVLFEFIEERREEGEALELALIDAGILRLRPVMITVAATVIALFPLAAHGGPLWEPLCYAQIGGLTIATFVTLGLVPVLYSFVVLDLKLIRWDHTESLLPRRRASHTQKRPEWWRCWREWNEYRPDASLRDTVFSADRRCWTGGCDIPAPATNENTNLSGIVGAVRRTAA